MTVAHGDRSHSPSVHSQIGDRVRGLPNCGSWFDVGQQLHMANVDHMTVSVVDVHSISLSLKISELHGFSLLIS